MLSKKNNSFSNKVLNTRSRRWLAGLLLSAGYMLAVVGDEANLTNETVEKNPSSNTTQEPHQSFWKKIFNNGSSDSPEKWQRPDSERNETLINQSTSGDFWNDTGNKENASKNKWNRPDSDRNKALINQSTSGNFWENTETKKNVLQEEWQRNNSERNKALVDETLNSNKTNSFWQAGEVVPTSTVASPFDIAPALSTTDTPESEKPPSLIDDTPIKYNYENEGPKNLSQALGMWAGDYTDQPNANPITQISEFFAGTKKYYLDFKNPYVHQLVITQPFLDIHSGPGAMYPKFYIAEKNETLYILGYQSDWYQIELRNRSGNARVSGWMPASKIDPYLNIDSKNHNKNGGWFIGASGGTFSNEATLQGKIGYYYGQQSWIEFAISEVLENLSNSIIYQVNFLHAPFGKRIISPFFGIGMGKLKNKPFQTTINQEDSSSDFMDINLGIQWYLSDKFLLRGDFKNYVVALSDNEIDSHQEYSIGFSVFLDGTAPRGIKLDNQKFIDRDDIELGLFIGNLALEDFLTSPITGMLINYHFSEAMFVEMRYATADISLKNNSNFFNIFKPDEEEPLSYYSLGLGLNVFTGEAIVKKKSIQNTIYLNAALGSTEFFDRRYFTTHIGTGLMITPIESWNIRFEIQDMIIKQDILGRPKTTHNLALQTGISVRF